MIGITFEVYQDTLIALRDFLDWFEGDNTKK